MRIVQQCIYFPPEVGGLESHVFYLSRGLVREGHEVTMVTSRSLPSVPRHETMAGVEVVRTWFPRRTPVGWALHTAASVPAYVRAAREADILHAQTFASAPPGMLMKRRSRPLVLTLHTSHFLRLAKRRSWRPVLRRIIRSADWLLAASEEIRDVALDIFAHPRAEALTNGVDTELFRPRKPLLARVDGRPRLIVPRRLFPKNGVEYAVAALPLIRAEADAEMLVVGDGPERGRLEGLAKTLGVEDHIRFVGARPNADMPGWLCSGDVAVLPSLLEATSVAALEAMSCGVPVAASRVGGLPEIVDESVGTLFEPADPADLSRRVLAFLERTDRDEVGRRARERVVERWSVERLVRRHLEIYNELRNESSTSR